MVQTRNKAQSSPNRSKFKEKLVGKGLSTDALLNKLKDLFDDIRQLEQEDNDKGSLGKLPKEFANSSILLHKDRGVKAYVACCQAEILRIFAPDAPYSQAELRDIFSFFFRQLKQYLTAADCQYYDQYYHLMDSLANVKSVVLVCDLPSADELMHEVFKDLFAIVRRDLPKKISMYAADILHSLIDESTSVSSDVLETIMAQFMAKDFDPNQGAGFVVTTVCTATADKLQRHICQHFTDIIVRHKDTEDSDSDSEASSPQAVENAHELIKRLNRACPALLHNVIPQLEEEMQVEDTRIRILAVQALGEMFAERGGMDLAKKYPTTWQAWLSRHADRAVAVRIAFLEATKGLIVNVPELRKQIQDCLQAKILDPDDKVRTAACKVYTQLDYETIYHHIPREHLQAVSGRCLDKKASVRTESCRCLGRLWDMAYPEIENGDGAVIEHFSWIPQKIFDAYAVPESRTSAEIVLAKYILPLPPLPTSKSKEATSSSKAKDKGKEREVDEVAWTERLLTTMRYLDEAGLKALYNYSNLKMNRPTIFEKLVECCVENNGGVIDEDEERVVSKLKEIIKRISGSFTDPQKASDDLSTFARENESRLYKNLKTCMDPQTDLKSMLKAQHEFLHRLEEKFQAIVPTMKTILLRATLGVVNQSSVPTLVKRVQRCDPQGNGTGSSDAQRSANDAHALLTMISKHCPMLYKPHVAELAKALREEENPRLVEVALQALSAVTRCDSTLLPHDKRTNELLLQFVMSENPRHSKFAARVLACSKHAAKVCEGIAQDVSESLEESEPELLEARLTVLQQLAVLAPDAFEEKSEAIVAFVVKYLRIPTPTDNEQLMDEDDENLTDEERVAAAREREPEWVLDSEAPTDIRNKILCIKICRYRCLAHAASETARDVAMPVVKMLLATLDNGGSVMPETASTDLKCYQSRLRLQAGVSLLHLATARKLQDVILRNFVTVALEIQDPCFEVRALFESKLVRLLQTRKLPPVFNAILFVVALDPEVELIAIAKAYVGQAMRSLPAHLRVQQFEMLFLRFIHLLAHHPDCASTHDSLREMATYLDFYINLVASEENISLLHHLALKCKNVADAEGQSFSERVYVISELAQELLKAKAATRSWSVPSYPGKVKMPPDIFRPLPEGELRQKVWKTIYLPHETAEWVKDRSKPKTAVKHDRPKAERKPATKRKATTKAVRRTKRARRKRGADDDDDDDDDEDDEVSSTEAEDEANGTSGDVNMNSNVGPPSDSEISESSEGEEKLGRGARTKAKQKLERQARRAKRRQS